MASKPQHLTREPIKPGFGTPGSVDNARLFRLPLPMQAEGVRLLFEMGQTMEQVRARLGLSARQVNTLMDVERPFPRGGEGIAG